MSSEGKESGPIWQGPKNFNFDAPADEDQPVERAEQEQAEFPPLHDSSVEPLIMESEADGPSPSARMRWEISAYVRQYLWVVGLPLLFGGCTCLILLPLIALERTAVLRSALLPVTFAIIIIAVAQGFALYKAGTNTKFWVLGAIGGFLLFVLLSSFMIFGPPVGFFLLAILALIALILALRCVHTVPEGYVDIVSSLGKHSYTLRRGFHLIWPWEAVVDSVDIQEKSWSCPEQYFSLSSTEDIAIRASISYQLMPEGVRLAARNWEESLHQTFQELISRVATTLSRNDVKAWQRSARPRSSGTGLADSGGWWERASNDIFQQVQNQVVRWCVQINGVRIEDVNLASHKAAVVDAELIDAQVIDAEISMPGKRSNAFPYATQPEFRVVRSEGPSPEAQKAATEWVQSQKEDILEKTLERSYNLVKEGKVTVPETIRDIADKFDAVARDPQKSKLFQYDAARAARSLYKLAQAYEEQEPGGTADSLDFYEETTAKMRRPSDENIIY